MTYQEFNTRVLDYYCRRATSTFSTLSLDKKEIEEIICINEIKNFEELKRSWDFLLNPNDSIPQYFGLIAVQCYAASIMQEDEFNASDAYQVRLREILGLEDNNQLQNLFRGLDYNKPIQEQIWHHAKAYLKNNFNQNLDIPDHTKNAGRFVQYPKSQALLNTEDLKYFTVFFGQEFQIKEALSVEYFESRFNSCFYNIQMTNRAYSLFNNIKKRTFCIRQLFDYYNSWEGQIYSIRRRGERHEGKVTGIATKAEQKKILLIFDKSAPKFYTIESDSSEIPEKDILSLTDYKYIHKDILLFTEMAYYHNEYEDNRFLYEDNTNYVLLDRNTRQTECRYLESHNEGKIELSENKLLFRHRIKKAEFNSPLYVYFQSPHPVKLIGGLKLNRGNEYLLGFGPSIVCAAEYSVIYGNSKYEYNFEAAQEGDYTVRLDNYIDIRFSIRTTNRDVYLIPSRNKGWSFKNYTIEDTYDIEGCLFRLHIPRPEDSIRAWIDANLRRNKEREYNVSNILLNAIKNSVR